MEEIWKSVVGYEEYYEISNLGKVYSKGKTYVDSTGRCQTKKPRYINVRCGVNGYLCVDLTANGVTKQTTIHRLLAMAFISNPENKPTVNHKDGNKLNIELSNLEWATYGENNKHAVDNNLRRSPWTGKFGTENPRSKPIVQYDKANNKINEFPNAREAQRITGITYKHISSCCLGKRKTTGGFIWKFK